MTTLDIILLCVGILNIVMGSTTLDKIIREGSEHPRADVMAVIIYFLVGIFGVIVAVM